MQAGIKFSEALIRSILASLPSATFGELLGLDSQKSPSSVELQDRVVDLARDDLDLQKQLKRHWRDLHADLVEVAAFVAIESSTACCEAMLARFGAENVLLEMITDEEDGGWELVHWAVANVESDGIRRELMGILDLWRHEESDETDVRRLVRVVILGGHTRDERKFHDGLFDGRRFDVRWKPFDKSQGAPKEKQIREALSHVDIAIVVTSMVSHNIMNMAKRIARQSSIPFRTVPKATDSQLQMVLDKFASDSPS